MDLNLLSLSLFLMLNVYSHHYLMCFRRVFQRPDTEPRNSHGVRNRRVFNVYTCCLKCTGCSKSIYCLLIRNIETDGLFVVSDVVMLLPPSLQAASLALFAVAIWVVVDGYKLYAISAVSGKDDIFAAAWIAIFTGFAFFLMCLFGIFAALKRSRSLILVVSLLEDDDRLRSTVQFEQNSHTHITQCNCIT